MVDIDFELSWSELYMISSSDGVVAKKDVDDGGVWSSAQCFIGLAYVRDKGIAKI